MATRTLVDAFTQRNNFMTVSDFDTITSDSIGKFNTKRIFSWELETDSSEEWIKVNCISRVELQSFDFDSIIPPAMTEGEFVIQTSFDNFVWNTIWEDTILPGADIEFEEEMVFFRIKVKNIKAGFKLQNLNILVWDEYDNEDNISFFSENFIPTKIREKFPLMGDFLKNYLKMLQTNTKHDKRVIGNDFFLHMFSDLDDSVGFIINASPINVNPLDGR